MRPGESPVTVGVWRPCSICGDLGLFQGLAPVQCWSLFYRVFL